MEAFLRNYRDGHPAAREWAVGSYKVRHSEETQGRIFRMAEQLRTACDWPTVGSFFSILEALDEVVDAETALNTRPSPSSASAVALVGYKRLFGKPAPTEYVDWPAGFDQVGEGEVELAAMGLRAKGFDPIIIDGLDPAAYLWALYEMHERRSACAEVIRLHEHPATPPRCLAVVRPPSLQRRVPVVIVAKPARELAGVAG